MRAFYLSNVGKNVWDHIKQEASDAFNQPDHGGSVFLQNLNAYYPNAHNPHITLVGHSAGSIYICELLQNAAKVLPAAVKFDVVFLAPACTYKLFADTLQACKDRIASIRIFAMSDQLEQADVIVPSIYTRSLLYLVSGLFEDAPDTPLLGMQRFFSTAAPFNKWPEIPLTVTYLSVAQHNNVWSVIDAADDQAPLPVVENILAAFEDLREKVQNLHHEGGSEGRLYIFLAGHSFSVDTEQLGIEESVLLMSNAEQGFWPHFAGHYSGEWFVKSGLFQEVVLFMDCCRNEPLINFPLSLPSWAVSTGKTRAKKFYGFATKWAQKSREQVIDGMVQGVFTWSLLKALRGDVTDNEGRVTEKELKGSIYNSVRKLLANGQAPGSGEFQDPDFEGDDDWVFAQLASKQPLTALVQIDFGQLSPETNVELIDTSHHTIEKHMPKDGLWQTDLPSGFYLLQVPATGQRKFFDVTGSTPITIWLEDKMVKENHDDATGKVHFIADAGDPTTEIFVIDSHFQRVTEGVTGGHGHLEADLAAGIYKIKFAAGFLKREEYVALQAGSGPVNVPTPDLHFSASAPIKGTRTTQDYHEGNANKVSKRIHCEIGTGIVISFSYGYNLIGTLDGATMRDDSTTPIYLIGSPNVSPLQDNGGLTQTIALLPGSPAIDFIPLDNCSLFADQRGVQRPDDNEKKCDIGAYEYVDPPT